MRIPSEDRYIGWFPTLSLVIVVAIFVVALVAEKRPDIVAPIFAPSLTLPAEEGKLMGQGLDTLVQEP